MVGRAGAVVSVELEARGTGAGEEATGPWQTQLIARSLVVTAAVGCACRGCEDREGGEGGRVGS